MFHIRNDPTDLPIRRNTILLAAAMAMVSATIALVAAIASLTLVIVSGTRGLLGLGPAIFLATAALAALPAGRAMDHFGRVPVLAAGFVVGIAGAALTAFGARAVSTAAVICGFVLLGTAGGTTLLARMAGGDMYPPERRARGVALVLSGAVFGAILGPALFGPLFAGRQLSPEELFVPWLAAGGFMFLGLLLVCAVKPDPRRIAQLLGATTSTQASSPPSDIRTMLVRPGVPSALVAAVASYAVMVGVMYLMGFVVVDIHDHHQSAVFPIIAAHIIGMYALVLIVGKIIDRMGREPALVGGLLLMSVSCLGLLWQGSIVVMAALLFGLGLGWNFSFVAATAELADRTSANERGKLTGFADLLAGLVGATLTLVGGLALQSRGVAALALGSSALALVPALWVVWRSLRRRHAAAPTQTHRDLAPTNRCSVSAWLPVPRECGPLLPHEQVSRRRSTAWVEGTGSGTAARPTVEDMLPPRGSGKSVRGHEH